MKAIGLLLFFVPFLSYAQDKNTFRKTTWGMTRAQVIASESPRKPVKDGADRVEYADIPVGPAKCKLFYELTQDQLIRSHFYYRPQNKDQYTTTALHEDAQKALNRKFGKPVATDKASMSELARKAPAHGVALSILDGNMVKSLMAWETPVTLVVLTYWKPEGGKGADIMMLDYFSRAAKPKK
ncbi:hypothetical protein GCM10028807_49670 [Spirosoma daeguense]